MFYKQSNVAPRPSGRPLPIVATVDVRSIRVDTGNMVLDVAFNLTYVWKDDRLSYHNLKQDQRLNPLFRNGSVWVPNIAFANTLNNDGTVLDSKASIFAVKEKRTGTSVANLPEEGEVISTYRIKNAPDYFKNGLSIEKYKF